LAFPQLDGTHGVCDDVLREAEHYGLNRKKSKVIYSGLRLTDFEFLLPSQKVKSEKLKLISVGRQSWMKGYHYALDALAMVQAAGIDFEYTLVGGGDSEELLFQVADLGLTEKVKLKGWLSIGEVKKAIQTSDVLLLPSVSEGIANTAIEAMALGTLVIASACGGMAELITDQQNGFLVPARNREKWVETLLLFAGLSAGRKDEIAANARHTVEERFNEDSMVNAFEELYQSQFAESIG
jgi:colanic acid/amylovoran biosynthesis glycosyltransferase